jgi:DNA-binding transcriptional LysR family regulator
MKQAVAGGLGLSILSRHTLGRDAGNDDLAILDVTGFPIRDMMWSVVYAKGKQISPPAKAFYEFLKERSEASAAGG